MCIQVTKDKTNCNKEIETIKGHGLGETKWKGCCSKFNFLGNAFKMNEFIKFN